MRFSTSVAVLAAASLAAAQTTTSTACAAQNIVDACLATTSVQKDACGPNDWTCLCNAWTTILTCYNNCPGTPDRFGASQTQVSYCNAAKAYASTTTMSTSATITASGSAGANTATATAAGASKSASKSASAAAASATKNAAADFVAPAFGGLAAILAGVAGFL